MSIKKRSDTTTSEAEAGLKASYGVKGVGGGEAKVTTKVTGLNQVNG